jgi:hypothetical protein
MIPRQRLGMLKCECRTIRRHERAPPGLCAKYSGVVLVQSLTIGRVLCRQYCELTLRQMAAGEGDGMPSLLATRWRERCS